MTEIELLATWTQIERPDGSIVLTAPVQHRAFAGKRHARMRIRHGAPLATLDAVCAQLRAGTSGALAELSRARIDRAAPSERVVTDAGEYGVIQRFDVTIGDEALCWAVGVIAGDDQMTVVDGLARSPNIAALVRDVLEHAVWADACERIRMASYRPPAGWFGVRRPMATWWLAPDAPAAIVVGDAVPRGAAERTYALVWPFEPPAHATRDELSGAVPGEIATWVSEGRAWAAVTLASSRWHVRAALRAGDAQQLVVLRDVVRSIELPPPAQRRGGPHIDVHDWFAT